MVDFLLFLGKMVIVVGAATMSYFVFYGYFPELLGDSYGKIPHLNYSFTPIICIAIGTYFITTSFFNVYSMAVDTIFLCFLQDLKQNDGTPQRPYFMSKGTIMVYEWKFEIIGAYFLKIINRVDDVMLCFQDYKKLLEKCRNSEKTT